MNVMDVLSKAQVFNSLLACGMKLSLSLVVLVLMLRYRLPDNKAESNVICKC